MTESEIKDHYEIALKIIAETSPDGDTAEEFRKWIACMRLIAYNALQLSPLDLEWLRCFKRVLRIKVEH